MKNIMASFSLYVNTVFLLFLSISCFADEIETYDPPCCLVNKCSLQDGLYVGVGGGYSWNNLKRNVKATVLDDLLFKEESFVNACGIEGTLIVGYGYDLGNLFYLGIEGFGSLIDASKTVNTSVFQTVGEYTYKTKITSDYSYGVSLLPGFKVSDSTMIYVRLGFVQQHYREKETESLISAPNGQPFLKSNTSYFANGFRYGFGFEQAVSCRLSLRGEFTHTSFQSFTHHYTSFVSSKKAKLHPSTNQILFSLIWHI